MSDSHEPTKRGLVIDSALLISISAAMLYFFGTFFRLTRLSEIGLPPEFARPWSLQEYAFAGGLILALLAPVVLLPDIVLAIWKPMRERITRTFGQLSHLRAFIIVIYAMFVILLVLYPVAKLAAHTLVHYRVVTVVPKPGVTLPVPIQGTFYVSGTEQDLVFVDRWADPTANVILVARDQVGTLVLKRDLARPAR